MNSTTVTELVLDALMMAVWRRRPKNPVMIHSDQGSHFEFKEYSILSSMSRRSNC